MGFNADVASRLEAMAALLDLLGADSFRASAHARAARALADHPADLRGADRATLLSIPGVGPKIADKVQEFASTGDMAELGELAKQVPPGLPPLLGVPGLGPKTLRALWQSAGVVDKASLERALSDGSALQVPRLGQKAIDKLKASLASAASGSARLWLGRASEIAEQLLERVREHPAVARAEAAGSLRRGRDTVGDLDILVAMEPGRESQAADVSERFRTAPGVVRVLLAGDTRSSVLLSLAPDLGRWKKADEEVQGPTLQADIRILPLDRWGSALMYFTGSKEHNVQLRERAIARGMTLSEWGLFPRDEDVRPPHERGVTPIACETEEEIYRALGLAWVPPEIREGRDEIDIAAASCPGLAPITEPAKPKRGKKPAEQTPAAGAPARGWARGLKLIELADIKAELHAHTTASDGSLEIDQLAKEAARRGFHTIAVTDHSQSSTIAGGLKPDRLRRHIKAVHATRAAMPGIRILAGSEVDILGDGRLDYDDDLLAALDVIVASPHAALTQDPEVATQRMLRAVSHPLVNILGHPTGRLISRRKGLEPDMAKIFEAAAKNSVAMEINAHWMRLDLRDTHVREALDAGCLIAIDCDVHALADFDNLRFGVATGRRGWLPAERCVNTWDRDRLADWLRRGR